MHLRLIFVGTVLLIVGRVSSLKCWTCSGKCECRSPILMTCPQTTATHCFTIKSSGDEHVTKRGCSADCADVDRNSKCFVCSGDSCNQEQDLVSMTGPDECASSGDSQNPHVVSRANGARLNPVGDFPENPKPRQIYDRQFPNSANNQAESAFGVQNSGVNMGGYAPSPSVTDPRNPALVDGGFQTQPGNYPNSPYNFQQGQNIPPSVDGMSHYPANIRYRNHASTTNVLATSYTIIVFILCAFVVII
ncbi:hypothetical protein Ddc_02053 [Ditylenchus destructor]|nr:hypothetical protein Ddc_02053 [Ditylenchus destructor]